MQRDILLNVRVQFMQAVEGFKKVQRSVEGFRVSAGRTWDSLNRMNTGIKRTIAGFIRFRMELLSVMFFGMAIQRLFLGLLQPALNLVGIFQIWTTILELLFLPVALALLPVILKFLDWVLSMSDEMKMLIGVIVGLGAVFGTILFFLGTVGLGVMGLVTVFVNLTGGIAGLFGPFSGMVHALLLLASGATGVKLAFKSWDFIGPIVDKIFGKLKVGEVVREIFKSLGLELGANKSIWIGLQETISDVVTSIMSDIGVSEEDLNKWLTSIEDIMETAEDLWESFKRTAKTSLSAFLDGLGESIDEGTSFKDIIKLIAQKVEELAPKIAFLTGRLVTLADKIVTSGLIDFFEKMVDALINITDFANGASVAISDLFASITQGSTVGSYSPGAQVTPGGRKVSEIMDAILQFANWPRKVLGFQHGGIVTKPTLAMVGEAGPEAIIPLGGEAGNTYNISPTYEVHASVSSDMDIRNLASKLNEYLVTDFRRLTYR